MGYGICMSYVWAIQRMNISNNMAGLSLFLKHQPIIPVGILNNFEYAANFRRIDQNDLLRWTGLANGDRSKVEREGCDVEVLGRPHKGLRTFNDTQMRPQPYLDADELRVG